MCGPGILVPQNRFRYEPAVAGVPRPFVMLLGVVAGGFDQLVLRWDLDGTSIVAPSPTKPMTARTTIAAA